MEIPMLTSEMITVFAILGLVVILLVFDLLRVDVVGLLVMTSLPLTGLKPGEATAGLGSTAVVVLICVMVIGTSLNKTGTMSIVAQKILNVAGNSQSRVLSLVALAAALPSAIMSNVGAAALMLPATIQVAKKSKIPVSKLVMPGTGFLCQYGWQPHTDWFYSLFHYFERCYGTVVGVNPPASGETFHPLGLFAVTPIGIALLIATIAYFLLIGCRLLPAGEGSDDGRLASGKLRSIYGGEVGQGMEFVIPPEFAGRNLGQLDMRAKYRISIVAVAKDGGKTKILAPLSTTIIEPW